MIIRNLCKKESLCVFILPRKKQRLENFNFPFFGREVARPKKKRDERRRGKGKGKVGYQKKSHHKKKATKQKEKKREKMLRLLISTKYSRINRFKCSKCTYAVDFRGAFVGGENLTTN